MTSLLTLPPSLCKQWRTSLKLLNANNILNNRKLFVFVFFFVFFSVWKRFLEVAVVKTPSLEHETCFDTCHDDHSRCLNHSQASKQNKQTEKT